MLTVTPVDDGAIENAETVILTVGSNSAYTVSGGASQTGTIADNDKATVNVASLSQLEGNGGSKSPTSFVVTVTLSAPVPYAITVTLATAATPTPLPAGTVAATGGNSLNSAGTDYQNATFSVTFAAGQTSATVTVLVVGDTTKESNEVFNVNVTNAGGAVAGTNGTITIRDDDSPQQATVAGTTPDAASTAPSASDLAAALAAAERWWVAAGVSPVRFRGVSVVVADLPGPYLGLTAGRVVTLDADAGGWGWFTDTTPLSSLLFVNGRALPGSAADGRIDLFSVLTHELGHVLGLDDGGNAIMRARLAPGVRIAVTRIVVPAPPARIVSRARGYRLQPKLRVHAGTGWTHLSISGGKR